jgi:uncharacterized protein (TIGR02118 family)
MIKFVYCLHRLPHLSREDFQKYWSENHGPLVRTHKDTLHIRRYVQVHTMSDPTNDVLREEHGSPEPYDGVAELWWDSLEDFLAVGELPGAAEAALELFEDEKKFIDHARSPLWLAVERPVIEG